MTQTRMDAINRLLTAIGQSTVNSIDENSAPREVLNASFHLDSADRDLQSEGWWFNLELDVTLPRDGSNEVPLPNDVLSLRAGQDSAEIFLERGGRLFNRDGNTFVFTSDPVMTIVRKLPFEDLPSTARLTVTRMAEGEFQAKHLGSDQRTRVIAQEIRSARAMLVAEHTRNSKSSAFHSPAVFRAVNRRYPRNTSFIQSIVRP